MVALQVVYDAFLAKMTEDDWANEEDMELILQDLREILNSAIVYFIFPRVSLEIFVDEETGEEVFTEDLTIAEIQILASLMKVEWLERTILTWENVKPFYDLKDFSQANLLDKFIKLLDRTENKVKKLQKAYYRSINWEPFDYSALAGGVDSND